MVGMGDNPVGDIKKKWVCMKSDIKGKIAGIKKERQKTGGGSASEGALSSSENRVLGIVGEVVVSRVEGGFDSSGKMFGECFQSHFWYMCL